MISNGQGAVAYGKNPTGNPTAWTTREKFNISFSRVASGWQKFEAQAAASEISKAMGSEISAFEESPEDGRLFIVGNMGTSKDIPETVEKIGHSLGFIGDFRIEPPNTALAGNYIPIQQTLKSFPIYGAQFTLHVNPEGLTYALVGTPAPKDLELRAPESRIRPEEAAEVVASNLGTTSKELTYRSDEILLPVEEELLPCYFIRAIARKPFGDWNGFVDLRGNLLALFNVASAASGNARGYEVNPRRDPNVVPLRLADLLDPPKALTGQRSEVWGDNYKRVSSKTGDFLFGPDEKEFDEPQLYYFLQRCWHGFNGLVQGRHAGPMLEKQLFNPMKATVHYQGAENNAFYMPDDGQLYFGDTTHSSPRYSSRSLDLVLHEFGHAISDSACKLGRARPHDSCRALSEGFSDYFAATVLNDPVIGDYFFDEPRTCKNQAKFPGSFAGEEHQMGTIWAGLLWDLRQESKIGRTVADGLALQSLSYLGPWRTITQGLEALLQADRVLFPEDNQNVGKHEDAIQAAFRNRTQ
jgi:Thermolysin metallopeptidase, catalytic domain